MHNNVVAMVVTVAIMGGLSIFLWIIPTIRNYAYVSHLKSILQSPRMIAIPFFGNRASIRGKWQDHEVEVELSPETLSPARRYPVYFPLGGPGINPRRFLYFRVYRDMPFFFLILWEKREDGVHLFVNGDERNWVCKWQKELLIAPNGEMSGKEQLPSYFASFLDTNRNTILWFIENASGASSLWAYEDSHGRFISTGIEEFARFGKAIDVDATEGIFAELMNIQDRSS